jgi:hypothetical protein
VQSTKVATLQVQMQSDRANAASLMAMLNEAQAKTSHAATCMRFAETVGLSGSEDSAFAALGM